MKMGMWRVAGLGDLGGRGCGLHPGRVGAAGSHSEGALQRRDAGDLPAPGLCG